MVSIIIPVYNRKELVKEAVASISRQTYTDYEVIAADDGSDDGLEECVSSFRRQVKRFKYVSLSHCGFPGAVRNAGIEKAEGEYIAFLDSDDLWYPDKLELQISLLEAKPHIPLVHAREIWIRSGSTVSQKGQKHRREGDVFMDSLKKCIIGPSTVCVRREFLDAVGLFRDDMEIAEDYELWLRATARSEVGYIDVPLVEKRAGHGSLQLSEKYGQIEIFRIEGLFDLVRGRWFADGTERGAACQDAAEEELLRKTAIYAAGARKRGWAEAAASLEKRVRKALHKEP